MSLGNKQDDEEEEVLVKNHLHNHLQLLTPKELD